MSSKEYKIVASATEQRENTQSVAGEDEEIDWKLEILKNRYIILKELGSGSYASVWLAYDVKDGVYSAVKISKGEMYRVATKEAQVYDLLKQHTCPHLMSVSEHFDYKKDEELYHCIVMELMGHSTYQYIQKNNCFDTEKIIQFIKQVLIGLDTLHSNKIIHGDLKPENILMTSYTTEVQKFIDKLDIKKIIKCNHIDKKGGAKILHDIKKILDSIDDTETESWSDESDRSYHLSDDETDSDLITLSSEESHSRSQSYTSVASSEDEKYYDYSNKHTAVISHFLDDFKIVDLGGCMFEGQKMKKQIQTCYYMSPEVLLRLPYDGASDMWAFGCTVYELLTGSILFDPSDYKGNEDRYHLYLITQKLGAIPCDMINKSPYKDVLFTNDAKHIKGFNKKICKNELLASLNTILHIDEKIINLIMACLEIRPENRITAKKALEYFS